MFVTQDLRSGDVSITLACEDCGTQIKLVIKYQEILKIALPDGTVEFRKHRPESYYCKNCLAIQKEAARN